MRILLQCASWIVLLGAIVPSLLFLGRVITLDQCKWIMLATTVAWFVVTPLWMGRETVPASGP
jgi:hypothetical protein